jgi:hypothetical protein
MEVAGHARRSIGLRMRERSEDVRGFGRLIARSARRVEHISGPTWRGKRHLSSITAARHGSG